MDRAPAETTTTVPLRQRAKVDGGLTDYLRNEISARDLINRDTLSNITILLTYRCPAACAHCLFESDSTRTETVNREAAMRLIEAAARQEPVPGLSFSGGEPFLQLGLMKELAAYAASFGIPSEVISSSAWAKSDAHADKVIGELAACGLITYCTSVDRYHTPYVTPQKMRTAVLAAHRAGLRVVLNTMVAAETLGEEVTYLAATLDLPEDLIESFHVNRLIAAPVGRARREVNDFVFRDKDFREGCPFATEIVTLSPLGFLYPCCGMVLGERPADAGLFIQDNIETRSVDDIARILEELKGDLFFRLMQAIGPYKFLQEIRRRHPDIAMRDRFVGSCDVCLEFTANPAVRDAANELLREYGDRLSVN